MDAIVNKLFLILFLDYSLWVHQKNWYFVYWSFILRFSTYWIVLWIKPVFLFLSSLHVLHLVNLSYFIVQSRTSNIMLNRVVRADILCFQPICVFELKVCVLLTTCSWICFFIYSDNFCLLTEIFILFTFNVITNMIGFMHHFAIFYIPRVFLFLCSSFTSFFCVKQKNFISLVDF